MADIPTLPWAGRRWRVVLTYRSENGPVDVGHFVEELDEIHDLVERGPNWNTLMHGSFTLARRTDLELTVEQASVA